MKKLLKAQFILQGTESGIKRIEKEIDEISTHKEVVVFNSKGEIRKDEYNGMLSKFLSTHSEIHSFVIGIYSGLTEWKGIDSRVMENLDVKAEPHYCYGGYIVGTILRWAMIISFAHFGLDYAWA